MRSSAAGSEQIGPGTGAKDRKVNGNGTVAHGPRRFKNAPAGAAFPVARLSEGVLSIAPSFARDTSPADDHSVPIV